MDNIWTVELSNNFKKTLKLDSILSELHTLEIFGDQLVEGLKNLLIYFPKEAIRQWYRNPLYAYSHVLWKSLHQMEDASKTWTLPKCYKSFNKCIVAYQRIWLLQYFSGLCIWEGSTYPFSIDGLHGSEYHLELPDCDGVACQGGHEVHQEVHH